MWHHTRPVAGPVGAETPAAARQACARAIAFPILLTRTSGATCASRVRALPVLSGSPPPPLHDSTRGGHSLSDSGMLDHGTG